MARAETSPPIDAEPAARGARLAAAFFDTSLLLAAFLLLAQLGIIELPTEPNRMTFTDAVLGAAQGFAVFLVLNGPILVSSGQTWGKRVLGIRIVKQDGSRANSKDVIGMRYGIPWLVSAIPLIGIVFAFADAAFIFNEQRLCLHDLLAGTKVVKIQPQAVDDSGPRPE
jgi:uncharacterized RDD family membrane protein YckC